MSAVRRDRAALIFAAVVMLAGALAGPRLLLGPKVSVERVVRQDFVQTVVASGRVETPHRVEVGVQVTGRVRTVPVSEGQVVAAGATLIELDASELRAALDQAQHTVQAASARMRQLREVQSPLAAQALRQAELAYEATRDALRRSEALLAAGAISEASRDEARRAEQVAAEQVRGARQQAQSAGPAGSDAAAAAAALEQAQAGADLTRARLTYATVKAPRAGTLIARAVEPGDIVQPGRALMVLSPGGDTQVVVEIDEKNLQLLRLGLPALASADAYPKERFAAELVYINPGVDAERGAVTVKLRAPAPPAYLRQDMTVSEDIETARRTNAVLVPADAVHDLETAAPWVLKVAGRRVRRQAVTLGLRSQGFCEVLDGLTAGDRVVPVATTTITDGARLRPVVAE
jgi:HlyD family secretion protein